MFALNIIHFPPEQESQGDNQHGKDFSGLEVFVQLWPKVVMDGRDDQVNLKELGGQAHHQEEAEEADEKHLKTRKMLGGQKISGQAQRYKSSLDI